jgi:hypothetical protein
MLGSLSGCAYSASGTPTLSTKSTSNPTETMLPLDTSPLPTMTLTLSPLGTPSLPPINPPTPTSRPTLEALPTYEAYESFEDLIISNGNCIFPCWWGLIPGQSSLDDFQMVLEPLLGVTINHSFASTGAKTFNDVTLRIFGQRLYYPTGAGYFNFGISGFLNLEQNTMDLFHISLQEFSVTVIDKENIYQDVYGSETFSRLAENYEVDKILLAYGIPAQIYTFGEVYDPLVDVNNPDLFYVQLLYPEKGIIIGYQMPIDDEGLACINKSFINMWLFPPGEYEFYSSMVFSLVGLPPYLSYDLPISESLNMSVQEFYTQYNKPDAGCMNVPMDIWPKH